MCIRDRNRDVARHARHARHPREDLLEDVGVLGVSARISQGCYEETAPAEFQLNACYVVLLFHRRRRSPSLDESFVQGMAECKMWRYTQCTIAIV